MNGDPRLPNLLIIGAQKCGTTALHYYLRQHPQIAMSRPKELDFFIEERNWGKGLAWYLSHFDASAPVRGESSPNYTAQRQFPGVVDRMKAVVPHARLIFLARDPVERLISHWIHRMARAHETRPLEEVLDDDSYLERSLYAAQLKPYLDAFSRERLLVLDTDELRVSRRDTLRRVFAFAGVEPDFWSPKFGNERHRSSGKRALTPFGRRVAASWAVRWAERVPDNWGYHVRRALFYPFSRPLARPVLAPALRAALADRLRADAAEFRTITSLPFPKWSV
jgi:hypothetical protein